MKLSIFSPLSMELVKAIRIESQRSLSVHWVLLPVTLTFGGVFGVVSQARQRIEPMKIVSLDLP